MGVFFTGKTFTRRWSQRHRTLNLHLVHSRFLAQVKTKHRMLSIRRGLDTIRVFSAPACLYCSPSKGPVLRAMSGGSRAVPRTKNTLSAYGSGVHQTHPVSS